LRIDWQYQRGTDSRLIGAAGGTLLGYPQLVITWVFDARLFLARLFCASTHYHVSPAAFDGQSVTCLTSQSLQSCAAFHRSGGYSSQPSTQHQPSSAA
jgi:hypothetical protein